MRRILLLVCAIALTGSSNAIAKEMTQKAVMPATSPQNISKCIPQTIHSANLPLPIEKLVGNSANEVKVFFSDIDGTLIPLDKSAPKGTIQQSVIDGAKELENANIPLILITGRSSREGRLIAQKIGIKNQFVIAQQGAEIVDKNGVLIYEDGISSDIVKKIVLEVNSFNKKNGYSVVPFIYVKGIMYMFEDFNLPYILDKPVIINSISSIGKNFTAIKVGLYSSDINKLIALQHQLLKKYPKFNIVISADCYCDVSSKTATKGHGIKILSEILGIDLKNIATIGDAENDITMLKLAKDNGGIAIAVDNANDQTKQNANYISSSASNCGFLNAVKNVIKNNNLLKVK